MSQFPSIAALKQERCNESHKYKERYLRTEFQTSEARAAIEDRILRMYDLIADTIKRSATSKRATLFIEQYNLEEIVWSCIEADLDAAGFHVSFFDRRPNGKDTFKSVTERVEISW